MASSDNLVHSADLSVGITANWQLLGENVGMHYHHDLDALFNAFVDSAGHLENLLDPQFTHLGVGVAYGSSGKIWTTHRFMALVNTPTTTTPTTTPTTTQPTTVPSSQTTDLSSPPTSHDAPPSTRPQDVLKSPTTNSPKPATDQHDAAIDAVSTTTTHPVQAPPMAAIVANVLLDLDTAGV